MTIAPETFGSERLTGALLDRLTHHVHILELNGESFRLNHTRKYAQAYCRISSYLQSMANQGYNPLVAIQIALAGRAVDNMGE